jgi:hypothetical protein
MRYASIILVILWSSCIKTFKKESWGRFYFDFIIAAGGVTIQNLPVIPE